MVYRLSLSMRWSLRIVCAWTSQESRFLYSPRRIPSVRPQWTTTIKPDSSAVRFAIAWRSLCSDTMTIRRATTFNGPQIDLNSTREAATQKIGSMDNLSSLPQPPNHHSFSSFVSRPKISNLFALVSPHSLDQIRWHVFIFGHDVISDWFQLTSTIVRHAKWEQMLRQIEGGKRAKNSKPMMRSDPMGSYRASVPVFSFKAGKVTNWNTE